MLVFNVNSNVEMLLLCQLHSVQSLWGFSSTFLCLCDLVKLVWQGSCKTCVGLGNLSSRRGQHLVVILKLEEETQHLSHLWCWQYCKKHWVFCWW